MHIDVIQWLHTLPAEAIYAAVLLVIGLESLGIPLPGEITLTSAALLASHNIANPWIIWAVAATGAIVGDSIGYYIGRTQGRKFLKVLSRWFPKHVNQHTIKLAEKAFQRFGAKTVFFGRFVAVLRIFAGPLAGILRMPYRRFLFANALGGIVWSGVVVWIVYLLGRVAEIWLHRLSWIVFVFCLLLGIFASLAFKEGYKKYLEKQG
ncbi:MAG: rane protein [Candidatus Saccharibacteria bacterium]|nr:rane protein [Candidatus Saccharibacteria bacterium]